MWFFKFITRAICWGDCLGSMVTLNAKPCVKVATHKSTAKLCLKVDGNASVPMMGDIADNCELCGQDIRYVYAITHSQWGSMAVGTDCCDCLTGTAQASEHHNKYIRKIDTRKRSAGSKRWKIFENGDIQISQKGIRVQIVAIEQKFIIVMNTVKGKELFDTVLDVKCAYST